MTGSEPPGGGTTYVYGVTRPGAAPPDVEGGGGAAGGAHDATVEGVGGAPVRLVARGSLGALVSDVDPEDVRAASRSLRAHARVLDAAVRAGPVVPLRFGTLVDGDDAVV